MVPDITRRTLLAGSGATLGAGLLGTGLLAPTWLPDPVTDALLKVYPNPPDRLWQPEVSDEHADEAVALLEETVERANDLKERVDADSVSEKFGRHLEPGRDPSGGWLDSAKEESDPRKRLSAATYGMQFAGEIVGYARVALDEADPKGLVERGDRQREAADDVLDSLGDYLVSEPTRDLAYLHSVEFELSFARMNAPRPDEYEEYDEYSPRDVASAWGSYVQATQRLRNARYYGDLYRENLDSDARPYADVLDSALEALIDAVEEFPARDEMWVTIHDDLELTQETPYGAARWELLTLCYDNDYRFGYDEDGHRHGHTVQRVVEVARELMNRRAHEFALDELDVSPDDTDYDSGRAFREKQRAVRTFRSIRAKYDSPFAGVLAEEASSRIRAGHIGLGRKWDRDDTIPAWRERVEAATYYLVGTGQMRELSDVLGTILDGVD